MATAFDHTDTEIKTSAKWGLQDWQSHLQSPGRRLIELHALTENCFLQIGESLHGFYQRSNDVSTTASRIADELLGDGAAEHAKSGHAKRFADSGRIFATDRCDRWFLGRRRQYRGPAGRSPGRAPCGRVTPRTPADRTHRHMG